MYVCDETTAKLVIIRIDSHRAFVKTGYKRAIKQIYQIHSFFCLSSRAGLVHNKMVLVCRRVAQTTIIGMTLS